MPKNKGFTLIEIMVVLVILGGITAVAVPNLVNLKVSWERKLAVENILEQVGRLGAWTRNHQQPVYITKAGIAPANALILSDEWTVRSERKLTWLENGVCLGGTLIVSQGAQVRRYNLAPPFCQPTSS